jgi:hypothetical protein
VNDVKDVHRTYKREYARLVEAVSHAVDRADPIGLLAMGCPADEYAPEVGTSVPRLKAAESALDVQPILHEEFVRRFDDAGPLESYGTAADDVWGAVLEYRRTTNAQPEGADRGGS